MRPIRSLLFLFLTCILLVGAATPAAQAAKRVIEFPIPTPNSGPKGIVTGPDGNIWFTEENVSVNKIGRLSPDGQFKEFPIPSPSSYPDFMTAGPDGNVWFTEAFAGNVAYITPSGDITEYHFGGEPEGITTGPDGNLWFATYSNLIGRVTPDGVFTSFTVPHSSTIGIAAGADGALWFTETAGYIGRITVDGTVTEYPGVTSPWDITAGPDGNLWFTEYFAGQVGRITLEGVVTEFQIPFGSTYEKRITSGPDGNLWFTNTDYLDRMTIDGVITPYYAGVYVGLGGVTSGPGGGVWFTENFRNSIGAFRPSAKAPPA
jgi:streptogramin lyase